MKVLIYLLLFFQALVTPLCTLLALTIPSIRKRKNFERGNLLLSSHQSFKKNNVKADLSFEVSSEGELEQVRPLLKHFLRLGKKIELVYFSDSVTHQCERIYAEYPESVRLFRFPALSYLPLRRSFSFRSWRTSHTLVLCRYDFLPELILKTKDQKTILVWGSLKSFERKSNFEKKLLKKIYKSFDFIFCATKNDKKLFETFLSSKKLMTQDFRPYQILKRKEARLQKIEEVFKHKDEALSFFEKLDQENVDVIGSYWPSDLEILKGYDQKTPRLVFVAPHVLTSENVTRLHEELEKFTPKENIFEITQSSLDEFSQIEKKLESNFIFVIMNLKGFLCELYSYSSRAYVSGGFGKSVHSLLEPAVSLNKIVCGPKVFRSTEFDIVYEISPELIAISESEASVHITWNEKTSLNKEKILAWHQNINIMNEKAFIKFEKLLEKFNA